MYPRTWLILALTLVLTPSVHAGESWVGEMVMARKSIKEMQIAENDPAGKKTSFQMTRVIHRVLKDQDGRLRIQATGEEGWVAKADMVLLRDAPAFYTSLIRQNPDNDWAFVVRAIAWREQGEFDNAIKDFTESLRLKPDSDKTHIHRGMTWIAKKEYDKALADFNAVIQFNPKQVSAYNYRGEALRFKKDYDKAIADYNEAIRLDPKRIYPFANRGQVWQMKKEYAKALADYDEALRLDPKYDYALARKAYLLATCPDDKIRNGQKAVELARAACELTGWKNGWFVGVLGVAHAELGQIDEAIRWEQKGLQDPLYAVHADGPDEPALAHERLKAYAQKKPWRE